MLDQNLVQALINVLIDLGMPLAEQKSFQAKASPELVMWLTNPEVAPRLSEAAFVSAKRAQFLRDSDDYQALGMLMVYTTNSTVV